MAKVVAKKKARRRSEERKPFDLAKIGTGARFAYGSLIIMIVAIIYLLVA